MVELSLEASQPCRSDKKPVLDINPKPCSQNTPYFDSQDRAKYSHHLLSFGCFCFVFWVFFLSHRTSPSLCQRSHLSLLTSGVGPCGRHLQGARLPLALPRLPRPGSLTAGADSLAPSTTFSAGHFLRRAALASCLSHKDTDRDRIGGTLSVWAQMHVPARQTPHLPAVSHLPEASSSSPPPPPGPPLASGAPPPMLPKMSLNPVRQSEGRSAPLEAFQLLGDTARLGSCSCPGLDTG